MNPELYDKLVRLYCIEKAIIDDVSLYKNSTLLLLNMEKECDNLMYQIDNYSEVITAKYKLRKEFKLS